MILQMLETRSGCEWMTVKTFENDRFYEVADGLAKTFLRNGWAIEHMPERDPIYEALYLIEYWKKRRRSGLHGFFTPWHNWYVDSRIKDGEDRLKKVLRK